MPSKAKGRQGAVVPKGGMELSKGSQNDKLVRTLVYEVRNNMRYQKEAMRLAQQAMSAFEALQEGRAEKPDRAAKQRTRELHEQTIKDRETDRDDRSRERNMFMNLTALVVVSSVLFGALTAVFLVLTAKYSQPWGYAGSGVGLALTLITSVVGPRGIRMLFSLVPAEWVDESKER